MAEMTRAQIVAWNLYVSRINDTLAEQAVAFTNSWPVLRMFMLPPSPNQVAEIEKTLGLVAKEAQQAVVSLALDPVVSACDHIDNSRSKNPIVKEVRELINEAYDALHKLKDEVADVPRTAPAEGGT